MIDPENLIITMVTDALETAYGSTYPGLVVYGTAVERPESLPCVTVVMSGNVTWAASRTFNDPEHHSQVSIEINAYSDATPGGKEIVKHLIQTADTVMQSKNFTRVMAMPLPNIDRTITRYGARYSALVEEPIIATENGVETQTFLVYKG